MSYNGATKNSNSFPPVSLNCYAAAAAAADAAVASGHKTYMVHVDRTAQ